MRKVLLIFLIILFVTVSSFFINKENLFTKKTVNYNGNALKISIDGEISNTLPISGIYYLIDYDCSNKDTKVIWNKNDYTLDISNGTKKSGVACQLEFKSKPLLSEMEVGSYVSYTGDSNNGCDNTNIVNGYTSCSGMNANYESNISMGYCNAPNYKFHVNGWRIGYVENGNVNLISAGATDCMCTDSNGNSSDSSCSSYITSHADLVKHYNNMNALAVKYCNSNYAIGGVCNVNTSRSMNTIDFEKITGSVLNSSSCHKKNSNKSCGWVNDLIDNGSHYWFATEYTNSSINTFYWDPASRFISNAVSNFQYDANNANSISAIGVRPVLKLDSSVIVTGGSGTYEEPYTIDNNYFNINSDNLSSVELSLNSIVDDVTMCISVGTSVCTNYIDFSNTYTLDLSSESAGEKTIYVYYKNSNGKIVSSMNRSITIE